MTASTVLATAVTPLRLIRSGLHLEASAEVASTVGNVATQVVRPVQDRHPDFGVDWRREPLPLWGDGTRRPDLGLRWLLEERARRQGRVVQVAREGVPFCDLELPADYSGGCAELISWIAAHEIGLIQYASHVGLSILLRDIIRTYRSQASIAVLFGSRWHLTHTTAELTPTWIGGSLIRSDRLYDEPPRVAVGRFADISRRDVGLENYDLVVVARATDALGDVAQRVLAAPTIRGRVIGLLPAKEGLSPYQQGRMMATFGPSQFFVPAWGRVERGVSYARLEAPRRPIYLQVNDDQPSHRQTPGDQGRRSVRRNQVDDVRLLRNAVWTNNCLNDFLALSAETIANGSIADVPILPANQDQLPNLGPDTSVILACDNAEHAAELARRLPDWAVHLGADPHTEGLSQQRLRALRRAQPTGSMMEARKQIMTVDALRVHDISNTGILIWCSTSGGLPPISRDSLLADSRSPSADRPLLLIDLLDRSNTELHRRSQEREWLCLHRGWVPADTTPEIVRSIAYDDQISGSAEQFRVSRRARKRHYLGEVLPRLVSCSRWYPQATACPPGIPVSTPLLPPLANVIHKENLLETYRQMRNVKGQGAGVDRLSYPDFSSSEITGLLRRASKAIRERRYRPHPTRLVRIQKTTGGWRPLRIMTIVDRVIATALKNALEPVLDPRFLDSSYGFRPRKSREEMVAKMMHDMVAQSRYVVGLEDVRDAFTNIRRVPLLRQLRGVLTEIATTQGQLGLADEWMWMLAAMLEGAYPARRDRGLDQGSPLSPLLLNLRLDAVLDRLLLAADLDGAPQYRFADNTAGLCCDVSECRNVLATTRALLSQHGMDLKGWRPIDLTQPDATANLLGFSLRLVNGAPQPQLKSDAYSELTDDLAGCWETDNPTELAGQIAVSWISAQGPGFEHREDEWILRGVYLSAARAGFRELGPTRNLRDAIHQSRNRWLDLRPRIGQSDRPSSLG